MTQPEDSRGGQEPGQRQDDTKAEVGYEDQDAEPTMTAPDEDRPTGHAGNESEGESPKDTSG